MPDDARAASASGQSRAAVLNKCKTPQTRTTSQEIDQFKTVGYTRCSTKSQEDERESNQTQQDIIYQFCQSRQRHLIRTYPDTNGGDQENRPQLWKALQHAHEEGCSITVTKFDRLTRTPALVDRIYGYGVPIIEAGTGKMIIKTQAMKLARKAARELDQKRASAKAVQRRHQPDMALLRDRSTSVRGAQARQHADDVLEQLAIIFEDGEPEGESEIVKALEAHGIATSRGIVKWSPKTVRDLFVQAGRFAEDEEAERQLD